MGELASADRALIERYIITNCPRYNELAAAWIDPTDQQWTYHAIWYLTWYALDRPEAKAVPEMASDYDLIPDAARAVWLFVNAFPSTCMALLGAHNDIPEHWVWRAHPQPETVLTLRSWADVAGK